MKSIYVALFFVAVATVVADEADNINFIQRHKRQANDEAPSTCGGTVADECCSNDQNCKLSCSSLIMEKESQYNDFIKFSNEHLVRSYEYLFMSAQFGTYSKDRPGFEKILHGLSDAAWSKGIEMIKETTKRGASHDFKESNVDSIKAPKDVSELQALAIAAEIEKNLLMKANTIHRYHSHASLNAKHSEGYDAALAHYLEEEIIEGKTETVRNLVGHVNDLKNIWKNDVNTFSMALYLFDQQLQK